MAQKEDTTLEIILPVKIGSPRNGISPRSRENPTSPLGRHSRRSVTLPAGRVSNLINRKLKCGILGATGTVGQRFCSLLEDHPLFEVVELGASEASAGLKYSRKVSWKLPTPIPTRIGNLRIVPCEIAFFQDTCDFVFSGLTPEIAGPVEKEFANAGIPVFTNAKVYRMSDEVPILIPPINRNHIEIVQKSERYLKNGGFIIANANCSSTGLCIALAPLVELGIESVIVTTLQAVSGAGYPGVPSLDILDNVVPQIYGEEDKLETEPRKILGTVENDKIKNCDIKISATTHRVPVTTGHTLAVSVKFRESKTDIVDTVRNAFQSFIVSDEVNRLPSSPEDVIIVRNERDRPQPKLDHMAGAGMSTTVGQIRKCPVLDVKFSVVTHNTIAGAAGGSVQNAELAHARGILKRRL